MPGSNILSHFEILDPTNWPQEGEGNLTYGAEKLEKLITHYKLLLNGNEVPNGETLAELTADIKYEWRRMKKFVSTHKKNETNVFLLWKKLLDVHLFPNLRRLVEVALIYYP